MPEKIILNDPLQQIKIKDYPVIVFCDNLRNFLSFGIKKRTQGEYSHVMWLLNRDGYCASQDFCGFRIINISRYLKAGFRLKIFTISEKTSKQEKEFYKTIWADADKPWFKRRYDYLGILGQLFGIRRLNNPKMQYCSEDVGNRLKDFGISDLPAHQNPSELNKIMSNDPRFKYLGHWFSD